MEASALKEFAVKAREPFKTALAMIISYGIALSMDWNNPVWAAFAVALVSLSSAGQSFNKAAMRMFGTLLGVLVALNLIALFPQERWSFMIALSVYIGICTYLMTGRKRQYFWNVSGFTCVIICMSAGPDPANAFETAVLRAQETGLGVLVYSLIAALIWPVRSGKDFFAVAGQLASGQAQFIQAGLGHGEGSDPGKARAIKGELLQAQPKLQKLLDAAESDTREVWEMRRYWRLHTGQSGRLTAAIDSSVQSLTALTASDTPHLVTNLDLFLAELDKRHAGIANMLNGQAADQRPENIGLVFDKTGMQALSPFQRAAVVVFHDRLKQLDQMTRALFDTTRNASGFGEPVARPPRLVLPRLQWPDPDRALAVTRVMLTLWLAFLVWIYVESIPGGTTFIIMAVVYSMIMASVPMISIRMLLPPLMAGVVFGSLVYMLILPHLSSFLSLGTLIFVTTFSICYYFTDPKQALAKTFALTMFLAIASIDNQQMYSFMVVATNVLMYPAVFLLLAVTVNFPVNLRQEKSFLRLLDRYFRSCGELLSALHPDVNHTETSLERLRKAFHLREISSIPTKLAAWAKFLDIRALPGTDAKNVQALLPRLQDLAGRTSELVDVLASLKDQYLIDEFGDEGVKWRHGLQQAFADLRSTPANIDQETYRTRLDGLMQRLEARIREILNTSTAEQFSKEEGEYFYRLLGAYQGVSESLVGYTAAAAAIDWAPWHEERF